MRKKTYTAILSLGVAALVSSDVLPTQDKPASAALSPVQKQAWRAAARFFEPNRGQAGEAAVFLSRGDGFAVALKSDAATLTFRSRQGGNAAVNMRFVGARPNPAISGVNSLPGKTNYYVGDRRSVGVPTFAKVRYQDLYPGTDLVYRYNQSTLEYDFEVAPHADPARIRLAFDGSQSLAVDADGALVIKTGGTELRQPPPTVYQETPQGRSAVAAAYALYPGGEVGFSLAAYDRDRPLVIDPMLAMSRFIGGSGTENVTNVAVDANGNIYITGLTSSADFPIQNAPVATDYDPTTLDGVYDAFVTKLDANGNLIYSTYLGGTANDMATGIALGVCLRQPDRCSIPGDPSPPTDTGLYIAGHTYSSDFPVTFGSYTDTGEGANAEVFVAKLDPDTGARVYAVYLHGEKADLESAIAVDDLGQAVVVGNTTSTHFPTEAALQDTKSGDADHSDMFITKLSQNGEALVFSTFLGGIEDEIAGGVAVDDNNNIFVAGTTQSAGLFANPSYKDYQSGLCRTSRTDIFGTDTGNGGGDHPCRDAFLARLTPAGALVFGTYIGGQEDEYATAVATDAAGNVYIAGTTLSRGVILSSGLPVDKNETDYQQRVAAYPLVNTADDGLNDTATNEAFVTKFDPNGGEILFSTFLRGSDHDAGNALAVTAAGDMYVAGQSLSNDFSVKYPFQATAIQGDAFLAKVNADGSLGYATLLGGRANDYAYGVAVDPTGVAVVAGGTWSTDFPVVDAGASAGGFAGGDSDGFIARVEPPAAPFVNLNVVASAGASSLYAGDRQTYDVTVTNAGAATATDSRLVVTVPVWAEFASIPSNCNEVAGRGLVVCNLGAIGPSGTVSASFLVQPSTGGNLIARFGVMSINADDTPSDNNAVITTTVKQRSRGGAMDAFLLLALLAAGLVRYINIIKNSRL